MANDVTVQAAEPEHEQVRAGWLDSGWRLPLATRRAQWVAAVAGLVGSLTVAVTAVAVGPLPAQRPQPWWYAVPQSWLDSAQVSRGVTPLDVVFYGAMVLMTLSWLVVGLGVRSGRWRIRWLLVLGSAWALPWLLAPVALSTDVYTYLGQGLVADAGLNPYENGPEAADLPAGLLARMSSVWLDTPSPYGPIFLGLDSVIAPLVRDHLVYAVVLLRLVGVAGLALAAVSVPRVARATGVDPAWATWFGVTSPLVLASVVLSGHNDGLMMGFLVAGIALFVSGRAVPGIAVCTLAALVKIPAAVAVAVLALAWLWRAEDWRTRLQRAGIVALTVVVVAAVVSVVTGVGTDWLNFAAVSSPTASAILFTPAVAIAVAAIEFCKATGIDYSTKSILSAVRGLAVVVAGLFTLGVLARLPRIGVTRAIGAILLVVVLASPVTWPWYLCWPLLLLGACTLGRARAALITLAALAPFVVDPHGTVQPIERPGAVVLAVLVVALLVYVGRWFHRTVLRPAPQAAASQATDLQAAEPRAAEPQR